MISEANNIRSWASILDENTRLQAERLARSPAVVGPVALMPDAHLGAGSTVGSVFLSRNFVIPACIGVDIGCGMIATRTSLRRADLPAELKLLLGAFRKSIPAGVGKNFEHPTEAAWNWLANHPPPHLLLDRTTRSAETQLGTLGSGNHFLEVCIEVADAYGPGEEPIWVVVHSGSRALGMTLANQHIKVAQAWCHDQGITLEDQDLAYVPIDHELGQAYLVDMAWAQAYAFQNRELMMEAALGDLFVFVGEGEVEQKINCHHNFAQREWIEEYNDILWVTRKGAIQAYPGMKGIIPGSMGAQSYITEGLGNPLSYYSSSHGAGRLLSRGAAKRTLTVESLGQMMQGCCWDDWNGEKLLDEHPHAYKPIDQVMADQVDLTRPVHQLTQIVNYKGL